MLIKKTSCKFGISQCILTITIERFWKKSYLIKCVTILEKLELFLQKFSDRLWFEVAIHNFYKDSYFSLYQLRTR